MKQVICPICGSVCIKYGKNKSGSQRWFCKRCKSICTPKIDNSSKQLNIFLKWLFSKQTQREMTGEGRTFRRKTSMFWDIWPMPPIVESKRDELLKVMPTDKSISDIYRKMTRQEKLSDSIPGWGDAIVWTEFHRSGDYPSYWD